MNKTKLKNIKVAIVYDRVNKFGGAERVLLILHEMFPDAPLYTSVYDSKKAPWAKVFPKIYTSFLQNIPFAKNHHELFGWLMPIAFEGFDFKEYDLVISVTSEAAKGIITNANTYHVCYMLTPTRYLWSGENFYFSNPPRAFRIFPFFKFISKPLVFYLKWWDKVASNRPDKIIAISTEVKERIKKYYNLDSEVVYPPVESLGNGVRVKEKKYYFIHGRFEPYKRLDLVIGTFNKLGLPLIVSGSGSEFKKQSSRAKQNIKFVESPTDKELINLYSNALAFLMPQEEDFGITSIEAQSFGIPIIAYNKGGALDTVVDKKTGIFFEEQTESSLKQAVEKFGTIRFNDTHIKENVKKFSKERFKRRLQRSLIRSYLLRRRRN